jgi:hypothetical protein
MRNGAWFIAITLLLLSGTFAFADDKSECLDGIKAIKAAVAKKPPKPVLDKLKRALDSAEQEEFEGDWDECVAAVRQAKAPKKWSERFGSLAMLAAILRAPQAAIIIEGRRHKKEPQAEYALGVGRSLLPHLGF